MTDIRFAFGFATEGPSLTWREFAEECDIDALWHAGDALRPALYSSLRSSPSHPSGVSALRVTIAIASARFARKQWGASTRTAFCRKSPRVPRVCWLGGWTVGTTTEEGRIKRARCARSVGGVRAAISTVLRTLRTRKRTLRCSPTHCRRSTFDTL